MGDPPARRRNLLWVFLATLLVGSLRSADATDASKERVVAVVGAGECADCASKNIKSADAFKGLHVAINCKAGEGEYQIRGVGKLDEDGKFNVNLPNELVKDDGGLKEECFAQLHGGSKNAPCPAAHDGPDASKLVLKFRDGGKHTFGTVGKLRFSSGTCASAWWWKHPWYYKPVPPMPTYPLPPKSYYFPPKVYPPIYKPPLTPPVYKSPPVYTPTPVPVYKQPPVYSPPPVYKSPPVYNPPVYKPPVYKSPVPVYKPPVYVLPPVYKPPCPPLPKLPPITFPPVYKKPLPPIPKFPPIVFPPVYKKPLPPIPQLPPKYFFTHPKFGYPPSYGWPPKPKYPYPPSTPYSTKKHAFFPPKKAGDMKP